MDKSLKNYPNLYPSMVMSLLLIGSIGFAQQMAPYCCAPPTVMNVVKPNILFVIDVTGSMMWRAAWTVNNGTYSPSRKYYGYFNPDSNYYYNGTANSGEFYPKGYQPSGSKGVFPGNIMNWACMSRNDVTKKVLAGGDGTPTSQYPKNVLIAYGSGDGWPCVLTRTISGITYRDSIFKPNNSQIRIKRFSGSGPDTIPTGTFNLSIDVPNANWMSPGVIRQICDKDLNTNFDDDAPRIALMFFSSSNLKLARQFWESDGPAAVSAEAFINDINNVDPSGYTPVAKAVFESVCYLSWVKSYYGSYTKSAQAKADPYNTWAGESAPCRRSFVVILGDGQSNSDHTYLTSYSQLPSGPFSRDLCNYDGNPEYDASVSQTTYLNRNLDYPMKQDYPADKHHPADDYAYYGHITDLRPDLGDKQNITFYSIFSYGKGVNLFKEIVKDGGFEDMNGDLIPDSLEWDKNGDGVPDNYYDAEDGYELEAAIMKIVLDILAQISSSSGAAVVAQGGAGAGGGITAQGQYYPRRTFDTGEVLDWVGNIYSLWLDSYGLIREDTDENHRLELSKDYVVEMYFDGLDVMDSLFKDEFGNGESLTYVGTKPILALKSVWDGGKWLWNVNPNARTITTFIDGNKNGIVESGEHINFASSNATQLRPYLNAPSAGLADTIIRYVRGEDIDTVILRSRTAGGKVWKLGDIIHSTPIPISAPPERYDYIYSDMTYYEYYDTYRDRRQVLYVGANDGMLHCFNAGKFDPETGELNGLGRELGEELWAYIPYNLLPHLQWLLNPDYCHVYYVDMKSYISDAQIFPDDDIHPKGWGTILLGAMYLGGGAIITPNDTCRSAYFALDITDPLNPVPLWEFTDDSLNYTMCYSTLVKVGNDWFLAMGSGPMTCGGECTRPARIYILDLKTGALLRRITLPENNSFITNIFAIDWNRDYTVDLIYFGTCTKDASLPGGYGGKIYRLWTKSDPNPEAWEYVMLMDMKRPITAEGSFASDPEGHRWIYFGTGRLFSDQDEIDETPQLYVGFRDDTTNTTNPFNLYNATGIEIDTNEVVHLPSGATMTFDALFDAVNAKLGWYRWLDAMPGERSLTTTLVYGGAVFFTTFSPSGDICSYGGEGFLYVLYYLTGTAYKGAIIGTEEDQNRYRLALGSGMPSEPSIYLNQVILQRAGEIDKYEYEPPEPTKTGIILWKGR